MLKCPNCGFHVFEEEKGKKGSLECVECNMEFPKKDCERNLFSEQN
jgi:hypothetical protein